MNVSLVTFVLVGLATSSITDGIAALSGYRQVLFRPEHDQDTLGPVSEFGDRQEFRNRHLLLNRLLGLIEQQEEDIAPQLNYPSEQRRQHPGGHRQFQLANTGRGQALTTMIKTQRVPMFRRVERLIMDQ